MDAEAQLVAIESIKRLKARYFRYMDTKDWNAFEALFAPDAVMDVSGEMQGAQSGDGIIRGRSDIASFVRNAIDAVTTVHHGHTPEIDVVSPTHAVGVWAMEDMLRWPAGAPIRALHGYGHYHETYEKVGADWLIASTTLIRLRVDVEMPELHARLDEDRSEPRLRE